jgi:hypothetical protein
MRAALGFACLMAMAGCGRSEPARSAVPEPAGPLASPATTPVDEAEQRSPAARQSASEIEVEGEVGGLDQAAVDKVVQSAARDVDRCWDQGVARNELAFGTIRLVLGVGAGGRPVYGYVEQSTLGDGQMQRCILKALSTHAYPKPVGGKVGVVRTSFSFELEASRAPTSWPSSRVSEVSSSAANEIAACKRGMSGTLSATVYVKEVELPPPPVEESDAGADAGRDADAADAGPILVGKAIAVGIAAPDRRTWPAAECMERVLSQAVYPTPGSWPAKVTFDL